MLKLAGFTCTVSVAGVVLADALAVSHGSFELTTKPTEAFPELDTISDWAVAEVPPKDAVKASALVESWSSGCAATTRVTGMAGRADSPVGVTMRLVLYVAGVSPCSLGIALSVMISGVPDAVPLSGLTTSHETAGFS